LDATFAELRATDVFDIAIVAGLFWIGIAWVREARARVALGGIAAVALLFWIARWLDLRLTTSLLQGFIALAALVLVVVFQDDLRRFFEGITLWVLGSGTPRPSGDVLDELASVCFALARQRVGALFVLPGREPIDRLLDGGHYLDGRVSEPLLWSLLDPGTPGHDGAIVIRAGRVSRFGVHLPLSTEWAEIGGGGTRHAAGLGLAERSDALCLVVSEERGEVSVAWRGRLERVPDAWVLGERLDGFLRRTARKRREPWLKSRLASARQHWREGVLAAALASGLWLHTVPGASLEQSSKAIPIVVDNVPEGFRVAGIEPPEIDVLFEGRRRDLALAPSEGFQVRVDGDLVDQGRRTFAIEEEQVEHPPELRVVAIEPEKIRLRVEPFE
jgi:DNA integrity scanning protein DisA with diadenylate cyclase activity